MAKRKHFIKTCINVLLSLKAAMMVLIIGVAIAAATTAFVPLYVRSTSSADHMAQEYMRSVSSDASRSAMAYFTNSQNLVGIMTGSFQLDAYSPDDILSIAKWLGYAQSLAGADLVALIWDLPLPIWTASMVSPSYAVASSGTFFLTVYYSNFTNVSLINATTSQWLDSNITNDTVPFRMRPYFPLIRSQRGWGASFIGNVLSTPEAVIPCGAPLLNSSGQSVGALYLRTRQRIVQEYFGSLSIAEHGRALLYDPSTQFVLASSNPADPKIIYLNGTSSTRVPMLSDMTDPLLLRVIGALGDALISCSTPCTSLVGEGSDSIYVTVSTVNDSYNLNKRLLVAVPSEDFLGDIREGVRLGIGVCAGVTIFLILVGIVAVFAVTRPLDSLRERLNDTKRLQGLETSDDTRSLWSEIRSIEDAFDVLRQELLKIKSFLPQAVLEFVGDCSSTDEPITILPRDTGEASMSVTDSTGGEDVDLDGVVVAREFENKRRKRNAVLQTSLNLEFVLVSRRVTVVVTNVRGFHALLAAVGPMELHQMHSAMLNSVKEATKQTNGVIQTFSGDHVIITWNAATHRKLHVTSAAKFIIHMQTRLRDAENPLLPFLNQTRKRPTTSTPMWEYEADRSSLRMTFGMATGSALCGNFGCEGLKGPGIIGPVVHQAFALAHQCSAERVTALINETAARVITDEFMLLSWNYVVLPQDSQPSLICVPLGMALDNEGEECAMEGSQLRQQEASRTFINAAFEAFTQGKFSAARSLAAKAERTPSWMSEGIQRALMHVDASDLPPQNSEMPVSPVATAE